MATPFAVEIVSADRIVWSGRAEQLVARTQIGEIGVLAGHEPMLSLLGEGPVRITTPDGDVLTATATDGFLSVEGDVVRIVAREAALPQPDAKTGPGRR